MKAFLPAIFLLLTTCALIAQTPKSKKLEKIAAEHKTWERCWVIMPKGDTVYGRLKGEFYKKHPAHLRKEAVVLYSPMLNNGIWFAYENDEEIVLRPWDIKEVYVFDAPDGYKDYFYLHMKNYEALGRLLVNGGCKYLIEELSFGRSFGPATPTSGEGLDMLDMRFFVLYKGKTTQLGNVNNSQILTCKYVRKDSCKKVFMDYPELLGKIQSKEYQDVDMAEVIKEFNQRIANNVPTQPKK